MLMHSNRPLPSMLELEFRIPDLTGSRAERVILSLLPKTTRKSMGRWCDEKLREESWLNG